MAVEIVNVNKENEYIDTCEVCGVDLKYGKEDTFNGEFGCLFIKCPACGNDTEVFECENKFNLTKDNLEYPKHFHKCNGVEIKDGEIQEYINQVLKNLEGNNSTFVSCGNMIVIGIKFEDEINLIVAKNYEEVSFPTNKYN